LIFFPYFSQSLAAACALALFFLTLFSYCVLLFFFQAKKEEQFLRIRTGLAKEFDTLPSTDLAEAPDLCQNLKF
jgi:hypothetical protein